MNIAYDYMVLVPRIAVDEMTMGEWLEERHVDYRTVADYRAVSVYEWRFASKLAAEQFARQFLG